MRGKRSLEDRERWADDLFRVFWEFLWEDPDWHATQDRPRFPQALTAIYDECRGDKHDADGDDLEFLGCALSGVDAFLRESHVECERLRTEVLDLFDDWRSGATGSFRVFVSELHSIDWPTPDGSRIPRILPTQALPILYHPAAHSRRWLEAVARQTAAQVEQSILGQAEAIEDQLLAQGWKRKSPQRLGKRRRQMLELGALRTYHRRLCGMTYPEICDREEEADPGGRRTESGIAKNVRDVESVLGLTPQIDAANSSVAES